MTRTIRITGEGSASAKADYVVLSLDLESKDFDYDKAISLDKEKVNRLNEALASLDYSKGDLKTSNFNVRTEYRNIMTDNNSYKQVFSGYCVSHNLKLSFDFDSKVLSNTLNAISKSNVNPELRITFTVKDDSKIKNEVLKNACRNAKERADILALETGMKLGNLISIDYSFNELEVYSNTEVRCMKSCADLQPEDVKTSDSVTFVWEIL